MIKQYFYIFIELGTFTIGNITVEFERHNGIRFCGSHIGKSTLGQRKFTHSSACVNISFSLSNRYVNYAVFYLFKKKQLFVSLYSSNEMTLAVKILFFATVFLVKKRKLELNCL